MPTFTATRSQIATYLLGVCPFSIAFLVFLNSSVSFVITDLLRRENGVGDAVGNLGFADELVALIACPVWGLLSDRIGVRIVCVFGYCIIGLALVLFVQAKNVYPQLLLGRLFFSLGGAAASTMVTAVLPTMSYAALPVESDNTQRSTQRTWHVQAPSVASEQTITPANYLSASRAQPHGLSQSQNTRESSATSRIAGLVGMATGCGALIALTLFLPLPARLQKAGIGPGQALQYSYYIVAGVSIILALVCLIGLRSLQGEKLKGWKFLLRGKSEEENTNLKQFLKDASYLLYQALLAGYQKGDISLGYIGGFVARASSVGISLFIPLLVNAAFLSSGLCNPEEAFDNPTGLPDIKRRCPRAYVVAAELTGVSQLVALICAPIFGYWSSRISRKAIPLMTAAVCGIIGYPMFVSQFNPDDRDKSARALAFFSVCLIGVSQIGAIVCSLGILSTGVLTQRKKNHRETTSQEFADTHQASLDTEPLLNDSGTNNKSNATDMPLADLKGSVAGIYSFYGGAGILLLTKAGGALFDSTSRGAPFYMMAAFNGILLAACAVLTISGGLEI